MSIEMSDQAETDIGELSEAEKQNIRKQDEAEKEKARAEAATRGFVLYTGGTIGMVPGAEGLKPGDADALSRYVRKPDREIWWDIGGLTDETGKPVGPLDSSSVGPDHWKQMAAAIERVYDEYDGFIILHGTDTMAYTGSALSFLLQNLGKPVILTGSQLPIAVPRTDAVMNFTNALYIAGYKATGLPGLAEVAICFGDALLRGNRTTKVSTSRWQGFDTPNYPHLGRIGEHIVIDEKLIQKPPAESGRFFAHQALETEVATAPIYPGMSADVLRSFLEMPAIKGFILRTFGTGNAPEDKAFIDVLREAINGKDGKKGKIVVNTTQCVEGTVEMGLYAASSGLQSAGVITGLDLTPEAALTKLMWLLKNESDHNEVLTQMQIDQRGEQTGSVFDVRYGAVPEGERRNPDEAPTPTAEFKKSVRPSGQFQTQALKRAMLRVEGVVAAGVTTKGEEIVIHVFVNSPNAKLELANEKTPQYAGRLFGVYDAADKEMVLLLDITKTVARVHETGRPLQLSLLSVKPFTAKGVFLTLFND